MAKPNLQQYFKENQEKGIFDHTIRATANGENVLFYIHPQASDGETLDFSVIRNELKQLNVSQESNLRENLTDIINGCTRSELINIANQLGLNYSKESIDNGVVDYD